MVRKPDVSIIKLISLCVLAAGGNYLLNTVCVFHLKIPLFLDTVFTAAISFAAGFIPGLVTALLTYLIVSIRNGSFDPFIICSITEVIIICYLTPYRLARQPVKNNVFSETTLTSFIGIMSRLMVLYIVCCVAVSVLSGLIDFFYYSVLSNEKIYFSAEDTFKLGLLQSSKPLLTINILASIPVNLVDRFIVIFGGYFISRGIRKLAKSRERLAMKTTVVSTRV